MTNEVPVSVQLVFISTLSFLFILAIQTACVSGRNGEEAKFLARLALCYFAFSEVIVALLTLSHSYEGRPGLAIATRAFVLSNLLLGVYVCMLLIIDVTKMFFAAKSAGTVTPKRFVQSLILIATFMAVVEIILASVAIATDELYYLWIYYLFLDACIIVCGFYVAMQLFFFRVSISEVTPPNPNEPKRPRTGAKFQRARRRLDCLLASTAIISAATIGGAVALFITSSEWRDGSMSEAPYDNLFDYLNHFCFALGYLGALLAWVFATPRDLKSLPEESLCNTFLGGCMICCVRPCVLPVLTVCKCFDAQKQRELDEVERSSRGHGGKMIGVLIRSRSTSRNGAPGGTGADARDAGDFVDNGWEEENELNDEITDMVTEELSRRQMTRKIRKKNNNKKNGIRGWFGRGKKKNEADYEEEVWYEKSKSVDGMPSIAPELGLHHSSMTVDNGVIVRNVPLDMLTYELKVKGKKNKAILTRVDIKNMERDTIVEDQPGVTRLTGRRATFDEHSVTLQHDSRLASTSGSGSGTGSGSGSGSGSGKAASPRGRTNVSLNVIDEGRSASNEALPSGPPVILAHTQSSDGALNLSMDSVQITKNQSNSNGYDSNDDGNGYIVPSRMGQLPPRMTPAMRPNLGAQISRMSNVPQHLEHLGKLPAPVENITLVLYEFNNVLLTNGAKYGNIDKQASLNTFTTNEIKLTFGGEERIDALKEHFLGVLKNNHKVDKKNKVLCFLIASELKTPIAFQILALAGLSNHFVTVEENKKGKNGKMGRKLSHVIGKDHILKRSNEGGQDYIIVLKLLGVLGRNHENVLYIGNNKDMIDHLTRINACHTHFVRTKGMTKFDIDYIKQNYQFGVLPDGDETEDDKE